METKITKDDVDFIKTSFNYAMERMESLDPLKHWNSMEERYERVQEVKAQQSRILDKLHDIMDK